MADDPASPQPDHQAEQRQALSLYLETIPARIQEHAAFRLRGLEGEVEEAKELLESRFGFRRRRAQRRITSIDEKMAAVRTAASKAIEAVETAKAYVDSSFDPAVLRYRDDGVDVEGLLSYLAQTGAAEALGKDGRRLVHGAQKAHTSMVFAKPEDVDAYLTAFGGRKDIICGLLEKRNADGTPVAQEVKQALEADKVVWLAMRNAFPDGVFRAARGMVAEHRNTILPWMHPMVRHGGQTDGDGLRMPPIASEIEDFILHHHLGTPVTTHSIEPEQLTEEETGRRRDEFETWMRLRIRTLIYDNVSGLRGAPPERQAELDEKVSRILDAYCYELQDADGSHDRLVPLVRAYHQERSARTRVFNGNRRAIRDYLRDSFVLAAQDRREARAHPDLEHRLQLSGEAKLYVQEAQFDAFRVNFMVERALKAMDTVKKMLVVVALFKVADASGLENVFPGAHYFAAANGDDLFQMIGDLAEAEAGTERDFATRRRYTLTGGAIGLGIAAGISAVGVQYGPLASYASFGAAAGLGSLMTVMGNASYLGKQYGRLIQEGRLTREMDVRNRNGVNVYDIYRGPFGRFRAGLQEELLRPFVQGMLSGYALEIAAGAAMGIGVEASPGLRHTLEAFPWEGGLGGLPLAVVGMTETIWGWVTQQRALSSLKKDHARGKHYFMPR